MAVITKLTPFPDAEVLERTRSICPICQRPVEAFYVEEKGRVQFITL